ncbi:MAG: hypothetical protein EHM48_00645 [Planctomycetaceae bacterium]|nr:MAG: hypothetical protein EHM48_00645 [Planctomycetaceae bacterium]
MQVRLSEDDQKTFDHLNAWLSKHQAPGLDALTPSDVLRAALRIAAGDPLCPHCSTTLTERTVEDGGTLGIWVCPECAAGNGRVVIET